MTKRKTDPLDRLLCRWLVRALPRQAEPPPLDDILRATCDMPRSGAQIQASPRAGPWRLLWTIAGTLAVLVAALSGWLASPGARTPAPSSHRPAKPGTYANAAPQNGRRSDDGRPRADGSSDARATARLGNEELLQRLELFAPLDKLFEKKWNWVVEGDDTFDVQVGSVPSGADCVAVAARLVILVRQAADEEFRVTEKTFILTREQELVETIIHDSGARRLRFWVYPIDEGLYTYDVDFTMEQPSSLSISTSGVIQPGKATEILFVRHDRREYRAMLLLVPRPGGSRHPGKQML